MSQSLKRHIEIAEAAHSLKTVFITQSASLVAMMHPTAPILTWHQEQMGLPVEEDVPVNIWNTKSDDGVQFSAREAFEKMRELPSKEVRTTLLAGPMLLGATMIGNLFETHGLIKPKEPLSQFAKHFRNAAAHGDKWTFRGDEPKYPARAGRLHIDRSHHGSRATFETVGPLDYIVYLDEVVAYSCKATIERSVKLSHRHRKGKSLPEIHVQLIRDLENEGIRTVDPRMHQHVARYATEIFNSQLPVIRVSPTQYL